ncbi:MAG TPA: hypothetical protein PLK55_04445 [archaeon]|nr:hypothetical protein [archaeon]
MAKKEKKSLIIWAVAALVLGVLIGVLITNSVTGKAKASISEKENLENSQIKGLPSSSGKCCPAAGGGSCNIGEVCSYSTIQINDYGDAYSVNAECTCRKIENTPNIRGADLVAGNKIPLTNDIIQKAIKTQLADGKTKYDFIVSENGDIIAPGTRDIAGDGCGCHTASSCPCGSICVSGSTSSTESDDGYEIVTINQISTCRQNYSGTSGYTSGETEYSH